MDGHFARSPASPRGVDTSQPSVARMYDYYLDGSNHFAADRKACEELSALAPSTKILAQNNRHFLRRAVRYLAQECGIRQFLDHGSGLPTQDNVHQVAQQVDPAARVVYVDKDPIVLAHGRALLEDQSRTAVIQADMRDTDAIMGDPSVRRLLDFTEPMAALFVSVLHCIRDEDDPAALVRHVVSAMPPGSFLVISHLVSEDPATRQATTDFMRRSTGGDWGRVREPREVAAYFEGLDLVPPGLVEISTWRQDTDLVRKQPGDEWIEYGGVARTSG
ncbi:SAM-dependent methyltransferase [Streptomyces buecherae]|uniref:SAM-dependent methyltransferase n=1 Tax=Streptomyces buecherae TaxID=2763006 RepID=UPI00378BA289